jgi:hypothetical protein
MAQSTSSEGVRIYTPEASASPYTLLLCALLNCIETPECPHFQPQTLLFAPGVSQGCHKVTRVDLPYITSIGLDSLGRVGRKRIETHIETCCSPLQAPDKTIIIAPAHGYDSRNQILRVRVDDGWKDLITRISCSYSSQLGPQSWEFTFRRMGSTPTSRV